MADVTAPIWKDTYYTTTASTFQYSITCNDGTIFSGKAYRMPNQNSISININKICRDYLSQDIDSILGGSSSQTNANACKDFTLRNGSGTSVRTYRFLFDYDYDHSWTGQSATLSESINGHYASGQMKLSTSVNTGGTVSTTRNNTTLYKTEVCADYVLHFVGARGGWMSFAFEGRCVKTDGVKQYLYDKAFNNTTKDFEKVDYLNEITTTYKLNTGTLTEEEASRFAKNVGSTTKAYLQIISEGKIIPVLVTDTSVQYKQDGMSDVITYEVNIKESQSKIKK